MSQPVQPHLTPVERALTATAYQRPEVWASELLAAGWVKIHLTVWESPEGNLFRGPYRAWTLMKEQEKRHRKSEIAREADRRLEREVLERGLETR